jgi:hypothetical protein
MPRNDRGTRIRDRAMPRNDRGTRIHDRAMLRNDRAMLIRDRGMLTRDRGMLTRDRGMATRDRGMLIRDRGMCSRACGPMSYLHGMEVDLHGMEVAPTWDGGRPRRAPEARARHVRMRRLQPVEKKQECERVPLATRVGSCRGTALAIRAGGRGNRAADDCITAEGGTHVYHASSKSHFERR